MGHIEVEAAAAAVAVAVAVAALPRPRAIDMLPRRGRGGSRLLEAVRMAPSWPVQLDTWRSRCSERARSGWRARLWLARVVVSAESERETGRSTTKKGGALFLEPERCADRSAVSEKPDVEYVYSPG